MEKNVVSPSKRKSHTSYLERSEVKEYVSLEGYGIYF